MSDWLWDAVTSSLALGIVGIVLIAAFVVAKFGGLWPPLKPYALLAGLVYHLAFADLALCIGFRIADERAEAQSLRATIAAKQQDLDESNRVAREADAARAELAKQAEDDQGRIRDYEDQLKSRPNAACTLGPDDFPQRLPDNRKPAH